jgi:hypothetical protein
LWSLAGQAGRSPGVLAGRNIASGAMMLREMEGILRLKSLV